MGEAVDTPFSVEAGPARLQLGLLAAAKQIVPGYWEAACYLYLCR
jgi:hypothetical protein